MAENLFAGKKKEEKQKQSEGDWQNGVVKGSLSQCFEKEGKGALSRKKERQPEKILLMGYLGAQHFSVNNVFCFLIRSRFNPVDKFLGNPAKSTIVFLAFLADGFS